MKVRKGFDELQKAKQEAAKRFLRPNYFGNIVGVGIGNKEVDGEETQEGCVRVYVVSKKYEEDLSPAARVPASILDVPTDIVELGRLGRHKREYEPKATEEWDRRTIQMGAPIRVDTSVPNVNSGFTGTLGAVVTDGTERYILSCNHIMAVNGRVPPGADIVSAATVNKPAKLAKAKEFISLSRDLSNSVDCGVALLPKDAPVEGAKLNSDLPTDPKPRRNVTKIGAVTGETMGRIVDIDADLYVDYSFGTFRFDNQVIIDGRRDDIEFATAGDSGAIVVDIETKQATAMIFAASGRFAIACSLPKVFAELGKQLRRELKLVVGPTRADAKTA